MEQNPSDPLFELQVDYESASYFREASKWAKFIAIVIFAAIAIGLVAMIIASSTIIRLMETYYGALEAFGGILIGVFIVVLAIYTFIALMLYRFADLTRKGIEQEDQATFNEGLKSLKNYLMVNGIIALLGIAFNLLGFLSRLV